MSTGRDPKTMPGTAEFREGYDRLYGDRKPQRGRWIYDTAQQKLVPAEDYRPPEEARNAPVMVDRFMEGASTADGVDIGSRRKREEYKRRNGVSDSSDVSPEWVRKRRADREARTTEATRQAVVELSKVERHNLRNAVDHMKGKR